MKSMKNNIDNNNDNSRDVQDHRTDHKMLFIADIRRFEKW